MLQCVVAQVLKIFIPTIVETYRECDVLWCLYHSPGDFYIFDYFYIEIFSNSVVCADCADVIFEVDSGWFRRHYYRYSTKLLTGTMNGDSMLRPVFE